MPGFKEVIYCRSYKFSGLCCNAFRFIIRCKVRRAVSRLQKRDCVLYFEKFCGAGLSHQEGDPEAKKEGLHS